MTHRSRYTPIIALQLSAEKLQRIFTQADDGDHEDLMTLADEILQRDMHFRAVVQTRRLIVSHIPVTVHEASDDARDVQIAEDLRSVVDTGNFRDMVLQLLDATYKGFSVSEMVWDFRKTPASPRFKDRDQRDFKYDAGDMTTLRRKTSEISVEEMRAGKYLVHEPKIMSGTPLSGGLCRPMAILYLLKSFALKDWNAFAEVFGFPLRIAKHPQNATDEVKDTLLATLQALGTDAAAVISDDLSIEFATGVTAGGGQDVFEGLASFCDRAASKGVLGQTLTTEQGTVGSLALAEVQERVMFDIRDHDADQVSGTIQDQFVKIWTALNYGENVEPPRLQKKHRDPEDLEALGGFLWPAIQNGLAVPQSWVRDKISAPEPEGDEPIMGAQSSADPEPPEEQPAAAQ